MPVAVQRLRAPDSGRVSFTLLGDDGLPVGPAEAYLAHLEVSASPNTVQAYAYDLQDFFTWLGQAGLDWRTVSLEQISYFFDWLRRPRAARAPGVFMLPGTAQAVENSTLQRKRASLAGFYRFHARRDDRIPAVLGELIGTRPTGRYVPMLAHTRRAALDRYSPLRLKQRGGFLGEDAGAAEVIVGIETDRGPWVAALAAAGYLVFAVNPLQAARFRDRYGVSGAKSDVGDAHALADMVRTDSHQLRPAAGDSPQAEGVKVLARTHKTMIWERTREVQRLRHQLREYFPAALEAFADLDAPEALELLGRAPEPGRAARLTRAQVSAALKRAGRRSITDRATAILAALRSEQLGQPPVLTAAYAVITVLNEQGQSPARAGGGAFWAAPGR